MQHLPLLTELLNLSQRMEDLHSLLERRMPEPTPAAPAALPTPPPPYGGVAAPSQETAGPAANPEAAVAAERRAGAAEPVTSAEHGPETAQCWLRLWPRLRAQP